jgi:zinc transporter ZupT
MTEMTYGAISMASLTIALFFLRFWRNTGDRFFMYFALSFFIEGLHRVYSAVLNETGEDTPLHYLIRIAAYGLILWAILEKNLPQRERRKDGGEDGHG